MSEINVKNYDIHYEFNDRTRRGEIKVYYKFPSEGDEKRLIGMVYKDPLKEKIWVVCGSSKEFYDPKTAVFGAIELDLEVKDMILELRKELGQQV